MRKFFLFSAFAIGVLLAGAGTLILLVRRDVEAQPHEELLYDDFGFSVLSAQRTGGRCAVELRIVNHAKRVPFKMDTFHVRLADANGQRYEERAQEARKPRSEISAGESVDETHVFALPDAARGVVLEVSFGRIPDALDWLLLGKRTWTLPP